MSPSFRRPGAMSLGPSTTRRRYLQAAAAAGLSTLAGWSVPGRAQAYPARPINFIVPWPAGSTSDNTMRALVQSASGFLGQSIVVENRPGASGMLGVQVIAAARPDGYTIGQMPLSATRFAQIGTLKIDPRKDLTPIARIAGLTFGIVVRDDSPYRTFEALLADARAKPGKLSYGSPGVGNQTHIGMEMIGLATGATFMHVPFKGGNEATLGLLGGQVDMVADSSGWAPLVLQGKLRLLCVWGEQRLKRFPDVPTLKELGHDIQITAPGGVVGPRGLPGEVVATLAEALDRAVRSTEFQATLDRFDMPAMYQGPADYGRYIAASWDQETQLIDRLDLREVLK